MKLRIIAASGASLIALGVYIALTFNPSIIGILIAIAGGFIIDAAVEACKTKHF